MIATRAFLRTKPSGLVLLSLALAACSGSTGSVRQDGGAADVMPEPPPAQAEVPPPPPDLPAPIVAGVDLDTVRAGQFDNGKMWTFEYPPLGYFRERYGFAPDSAWFEQARLGALRLPNCTASFVSPHGLVMTNHHCARDGVSAVSGPDERLLDNGFYARSLADERRWDETYVDQLIGLIDISDEALAAADDTRDAILQGIGDRIAEEFGGDDAGIVVETIALWNGARYSAYVFKRYEDVRIVFAPELRLGEFGGEPDNFTYPRYTLDMSLLRVYGDDGNPLDSEHFFRWSERGVEDGDAVFVIGNPGTTNRLQTMAQLEFRRDVGEKAIYTLFQTRAEALRSYYEENPEEGESINIRNDINTLANFDKFYGNVWQALHDPVLMTRRRDSERAFREAIENDPTLRERYGELFDQMAEVQAQKAELADGYGAFVALSSGLFTSALLRRAFFAIQYVLQRDRGGSAEVIASLEESLLGVGDQPPALQKRVLTARLRDFQNYLGEDSEVVRQILGGQASEDLAAQIVDSSVLADSAATAAALADGSLTLDDPGLQLEVAFIGRFANYQSGWFPLLEQENELASSLGRAHYDVYGTRMPPDATFSLRVADGVVTGYEYNGTIAPVYTTMYGLYDHYYSYGAGADWDLPERWLDPPASFDRSTPLNFVMTADIIGGNSGSPVLNQDLEVVGLIFDGNVESNAGDFIYVPIANRAIAVDARGMLEVLDEMYDADRLVLELTSGRLAETEAEADAVRAGR